MALGTSFGRPMTWVMVYVLGLICLNAPVVTANLLGPSQVVVHHLHSGTSRFIDVNDTEKFNIFCRKGDLKKLANYFRSATLRIISTAEDIKILKGYSVEDVKIKYMQTPKLLLWAANLLPWRARETTYPTFNTSCVGITSGKPYSAMLIVRPLDFRNLAVLIAGLSLFFLAPKLSRSTFFFYSSGTVVGAMAAALILLFFLRKFLPGGKVSTFTITVLSSVVMYWAGETWNRFYEIVHQQLPYILVYLTSGALLSFITCYRIGPPTHPKTLNIINWTLQGASLVLIHLSSDLVEVSTMIIVIVILYQLLGNRFYYGLQKWWKRRFPPKTKLLTEQEYIAQGAIETQKGLEELRKYCNSPDCDSWKLVTRLKDAKRFSSFMQGDSHLSDSEMMDYGEETENEDGEEVLLDEEEFTSAGPSPFSRSVSNGNGHSHTTTFSLTDDDSD